MTSGKRVIGERVRIASDSIHDFFEVRGALARDREGYTSVLYQDKNPGLADDRDRYEKRKIVPLLRLTGRETVLDLGCGVGRWADAIVGNVREYHGVDASRSLIEVARARRGEPHVYFHLSTAESVGELQLDTLFDRAIFSGLFLYMNDDQLYQCLNGLGRFLQTKCLIYIREPLALGDRLTLQNIWSDEMQAEYSAIYRSRDELTEVLKQTLGQEGFCVPSFTPLYEAELQLDNRVETKQHFAFVRRGDL